MRTPFHEELIRRSDIVAVARELGLEVRGTKCRCLRPEAHAHGDRTPSLTLFPRDNSFRCWVCPDVHGSVIDLVMLARGLPFGDAADYLAGRLGMVRPERERSGGRAGAARQGGGVAGRPSRPAGSAPGMPPRPSPGPGQAAPPAERDDAPPPRVPAGEARSAATPATSGSRAPAGPASPAGGRPGDAHTAVGAAVDSGTVRLPRGSWAAPPEADVPPVDDERTHEILSHFLRWCDRPSAGGYLTRQRRISSETITRMRIVSLGDGRTAESRLRDLFSPEELVGCGLFNEWGLIFRRHPVLFPFLRRERVLFVQGRRIDGREPKYLSLRRAIPCLYNQDVLDTLPEGSPVLLCEGVIDTLTWLDQGVPAVGILGVSGLKREWIEALRPFRVLLCLDNDAPGRRAAHSLQQAFAAAGQQAAIVALPDGVKDVNQLVAERGHKDIFKNIL